MTNPINFRNMIAAGAGMAAGSIASNARMSSAIRGPGWFLTGFIAFWAGIWWLGGFNPIAVFLGIIVAVRTMQRTATVAGITIPTRTLTLKVMFQQKFGWAIPALIVLSLFAVNRAPLSADTELGLRVVSFVVGFGLVGLVGAASYFGSKWGLATVAFLQEQAQE